MKPEGIYTELAPAAIGPYRQAVAAGDFLYTSGQVAIDPFTQAFIQRDVAAETERVLESLKAVLEAGGSSLDQVLKVTIYLRDMADYAVVNEVYARYFKAETAPAREAVQVGGLPKNARVEISAVALRSRS